MHYTIGILGTMASSVQFFHTFYIKLILIFERPDLIKSIYFEGVKRIKPTHASITATLEPISAGVIAAVFLGEVMATLQIVGGLIVIVSIIMLQLNTADN